MVFSDNTLDNEKLKFKEISNGTVYTTISPAFIRQTLISGTTTAGTTESFDVKEFNIHTVHASVVAATAGVNAGTVQVQGSLDDSNWVNITESFILAGSASVINVSGTVNSTRISDIRILVTGLDSGTLTVELLSGN